MARTKPLTNTEIKNAKPREKVYKLSDGDGLQLRVKPNGNKSWLLDYVKPVTKKRTALGLGGYPTITLLEARKLRDEYRALITRGIDPKDHKEQKELHQRSIYEHTFANVAKQWFEVKKTQVSEKHAIDLWRSVNNHLMPEFADTPINQITAPKTIAILKPVAEKGSLETVKRLCQRINEVMGFAVNTGIIESNPLFGIRAAFQKPVKKHMPTITPEELPQLLKDISYASIRIVTRLLIEWQLHTMVRPSEAAGAKWSEIDLDNNVWVIPAERMKKKREHVVPLTAQTVEILERLKPISAHREYMFPADRNPRTHTNEQTANMALKRMGYEKRLVAHGLRALASTTLNQEGFNADIIEAALAHVDKNDVRRAYNRADYLDKRRDLMNWWSAHIEQAAQTGVLVKSTQVSR